MSRGSLTREIQQEINVKLVVVFDKESQVNPWGFLHIKILPLMFVTERLPQI
jgi:hypothetical protein